MCLTLTAPPRGQAPSEALCGPSPLGPIKAEPARGGFIEPFLLPLKAGPSLSKNHAWTVGGGPVCRHGVQGSPRDVQFGSVCILCQNCCRLVRRLKQGAQKVGTPLQAREGRKPPPRRVPLGMLPCQVSARPPPELLGPTQRGAGQERAGARPPRGARDPGMEAHRASSTVRRNHGGLIKLILPILIKQ